MLKSIGAKVLSGVLFCAFVGALVIYFVTTLGYEELSDRSAKRTLTMTSEAIFQTLRLAMFSGDRIVIEDALKRASTIDNVHSLVILPNETVIRTFDLAQPFTEDPDVIRVFERKEMSWFETNNDTDHFVRLLKPLIAEPICVRCHYLNQVQDVLGVMDLSISLRASDMMIRSSQAKLGLFMTIALTIACFAGIIFFRAFTNRLHAIQSGLLNFFAFLNQKQSRVVRLAIDSDDELGQMAQVINSNIAKIEVGLARDSHFIEEVTKIVARLNTGILSDRLSSEANSPALNALKGVINQMLFALDRNVEDILSVLKAYEEDNYTAFTSASSLQGELRGLNDGVNRLGESISRLLKNSLDNGKKLENNAKELSGFVQALTTATSSQASALLETSEEVSAITDAIRENALKAGQMANIAEATQNSANEGSILASKTQSAMEQIVFSANAINEAISVIDAIAFQTNILSLNAAVEAATAGEAGKGFAVVAGEVRSLAARSADAARTIKDLVEKSQRRAEEGKDISAQMMQGYSDLSYKIAETSGLVSRVAEASVEQMKSIEHINTVVDTIERMTQESAGVAQKTHEIATRTSDMAQELVNDASGKKFRNDPQVEERRSNDFDDLSFDLDEDFGAFDFDKHDESETIATDKTVIEGEISQLKELIESGLKGEETVQ
ncbi:hypothetical protein AGMMS50229_15200 [Campylobacterota bacterium]|nr:hypothetical protein AGMMS50229_15200 [Campylobacterota bacterium]